MDQSKKFWLRHAWWPLAVFVTIFGALEVFSLDRTIANAWFFNALTGQWSGSGAGDWWAHGVLHTDGRWLVRGVAAAAILAWALSFAFERLRSCRTPAGYVALAMLLATGIVGGLKSVTNVDCPWDLAGYGGENPYVSLFADRPDLLVRAKCFPGAHSSSGFALLCFYFVYRDRSRTLARWALAAALAIGIAFSIGQEARGAHFITHDLASLGIVWFVQLALYVRMLRPELQTRASASSGRCIPQSTKSNESMCSGP